MSAVLRAFPFALPRIGLPPSSLLVGVVASAYALPGLFGHDPWKPEDAIGIGIVHQMLEPGHWLLPHLAGELYAEDGPFYYWLAAVFARLLSFLFGVDDAARLASAAAVIGTLFLLRAAAREVYGRSPGDAAALVLLGCLGLLIHAHEALGELGMLAGQALAWYGIALAPRKPHKAGVALGIGLAIAVLSKGPWAAVAPALTALVLPALSPHWRGRAVLLSLLEGLVAFAVPVGLWAAAIALSSPEQGSAWLTAHLNTVGMPGARELFYDLKVLSWSAWPAWPIALWLVWSRRESLSEPGLLFGVTATVLTLLAVLALRETREVHTLAALLPFALLAGAGVERLRRGAVHALEWFGAITFSFFGLLVWLGWFATMTGTPARIAKNLAKLEPGHVPMFEWLPFIIALVLSFAWIWVLLRSERSPHRSVLFWACGATLLWGLTMTLLLSWIDYGKTYRPIALSMSVALDKAFPRGVRCVESRGLGESQRAALDYHGGIVTRRAEVHGTSRCPALLVQAHPDEDDRRLGKSWKRIWEGTRPRDKERYRLYVRTP